MRRPDKTEIGLFRGYLEVFEGVLLKGRYLRRHSTNRSSWLRLKDLWSNMQGQAFRGLGDGWLERMYTFAVLLPPRNVQRKKDRCELAWRSHSTCDTSYPRPPTATAPVADSTPSRKEPLECQIDVAPSERLTRPLTYHYRASRRLYSTVTQRPDMACGTAARTPSRVGSGKPLSVTTGNQEGRDEAGRMPPRTHQCPDPPGNSDAAAKSEEA